jgi:hypothetical protein
MKGRAITMALSRLSDFLNFVSYGVFVVSTELKSEIRFVEALYLNFVMCCYQSVSMYL